MVEKLSLDLGKPYVLEILSNVHQIVREITTNENV